MKEKILNYLNETYAPVSILLYGSYADGTNDEFSDFDCMLIVPEKERKHDDTEICGVPLDCFIFTEEEVKREEDIEVFLTAYDAEIIKDNGIGKDLQTRVRAFVSSHEKIETSEKEFIVSWMRKTLCRMEKDDDEGNYRAVALLWESLPDYFLLRDKFYFGSKKAIRYLKENDPEAFALFHKAITEKTADAIRAWAEYLIG